MSCSPEPKPEVRALTTETALGRLLAQSNSAAGVNVNEQNALTYSAVWRAITLIGQLVGRMPLHVHRTSLDDDARERVRRHPVERLLNRNANRYVDAAQLRETMTMLALTWGHAEAEIERTGSGEPIGLYLLKPWQTKIEQLPTGELYFKVTPDNAPSYPMAFDNVLSIIGPSPDALTGYRPVQMARDSIALAVAMERFGASYFGNSARPGGVLKTTEKLDDVAYNRLRESVNERYKGVGKTGEVMLLEGGVDFEAFELKNDEAQFLGGRQFQLVEVARWFGIAPHLLFDLTRSTFSNIEEQGQDFLTYCLDPWVDRWEQECTRKLLPYSDVEDLFVEAVVDAILRASTEKRYAAYATGLAGQSFLTVNEVRRKENLPPVPGGDVLMRPLNMGRPDDEKPTEDEPEQDDEQEADETEVELQNSVDPKVAAFRSMLGEAIGRALSIQANAAMRLAKKPDGFLSALDDFPKEHRSKTEEIVGPAVRCAVAVLGLGQAPGLLVEQLAHQLVEGSRARLLEASGTATPEQLLAVVEQETKTWEQRAAKTAADIFTEGK